MIGWLPVVRLLVVQVAWNGAGPMRATAPQPTSGVEEPSAKNATVPPPLPDTVAVNVTGWPVIDGFAEDDTVVVATVVLVWPAARVPVLGANWSSPV